VTRIISLVVLLAIVVLCGWFVLQVMGQFLLPMFLAVVMVVVFRPLHIWLTNRLNGRVRVAAGLTTATILLIVLLPLLAALAMAATQGISLARNLSQEKVLADLTELRKRFSLEMPGKETFQAIDHYLNAADSVDSTLETRTDARLQIAKLMVELRGVVDEAMKSPSSEAHQSDELFTIYAELMKQVEPWESLRFEASVDSIGDLQRLSLVRNSYDKFKASLFGSPWSYRLKSMANPSPTDIRRVRQQIDQWLGPMALSTTQFVGGFLGRLLVGLGVMVISLYFFFADGPDMVRTVMRLSPLEDRYEREMLDEFDRISRAVVLATLLSAGAQGLLAGAGYFVAGLDSIVLLAFLTGLFAMVPFVGAAAVWLPCSLWLFLIEGRPMAACGLAVYGGLVVSMADNVIKPYILHGQSNMHPLMALLSVLGGVQVLGPIGIFVGPMIVAFLQALLNILQHELSELDQQAASSGESVIEAALHHPHPET